MDSLFYRDADVGLCINQFESQTFRQSGHRILCCRIETENLWRHTVASHAVHKKTHKLLNIILGRGGLWFTRALRHF